MKKKYNTLVLNRLYIPIHIITWKRAVSILYQGLGSSLDLDFIPYNYDEWIKLSTSPTFDETYYNYIHSVSTTIAVPDILVLKEFAFIPKRDTKYSRQNIFHRDEKKCAYCGKKFTIDDLTIDHIVPKSHGGKNTWMNTITACKACNNKKDDRTPDEAHMPLLYDPREPRWTDTFSNVVNNPDMRESWKPFMKSIGVE